MTNRANNGNNGIMPPRGGVGNNFTTKPKGRNNGAGPSTSVGTPTRQNGYRTNNNANINNNNSNSTVNKTNLQNNSAVATAKKQKKRLTQAEQTKLNNETKLIHNFVTYLSRKNVKTELHELYPKIYNMTTKNVKNVITDDLVKYIKTNIPIETKVVSLMSAIGSNSSNRTAFLNSIKILLNEKNEIKIKNNILNSISSLKRAVKNRVNKDTEITPSTFITHLLGNNVKKYNNKQLETLYNRTRKNNIPQNKIRGRKFEIEFDEKQEAKFFKYMLADIIHDSNGHYKQSKLKDIRNGIKNILFSTDKYNKSTSNIDISTIFGKEKRVILKQGKHEDQYSKSLVNNVASKTMTQKIENNSIKITRGADAPTINRNGKNLVRYKVLGNDGKLERYYKQFNVILNSNKDSVFKNFIHSLLRTNKNRKIGSFLICPALLLNSGVHKTSVSPVQVVRTLLNGQNISRNIYEINSKRMNIVLKFPGGKTDSNGKPMGKTCRLQILFDPQSKQYKVRINEKIDMPIMTQAASAASNKAEDKLAKFLGDFMIILKVIIESKSKNKPIAFATFDNMAALIYLFMCDVVGVKPRLFFTNMRGGERTLYIHGMNDIISNQCSLTTSEARAKRKRITAYLNKSKQNNTTYASNSNNNNNSRTKSRR